ncbi:MAG: radical SAM protein, partial [Pyrinomonadaceae bacterium]
MHDSTSERHFWDALAIETELAAQSIPEQRRTISTIFVGGGTPSMIGIEQFANWLHLVKSHFHVPDNIEFSFECNPDSVTLELMQTLKSLGVTRPTIGIESFDTRALKALNRPQTVE